MLASLCNILRDDFSDITQKTTKTKLARPSSFSAAMPTTMKCAWGLAWFWTIFRRASAVSSNDVRRMVPFRRRNEGKNVTRIYGYLEVTLLERTFGADPMAQRFAILAGNTRAYEKGWRERPNDWSIKTNGSDGNDGIMDALSEYRIPPSIHDLFVNDLHRRFFQRLHRVPQDDPVITGRNCDNHEIYASSPSYLITAGGSPATYAIDPHFLGTVPPEQDQQLGVAVTTSFIPTGLSAGDRTTAIGAKDLIQFSSFSADPGKAVNYGVAPDFACGHRVDLPARCRDSINPEETRGKFSFVNKGSRITNEDERQGGAPGFYLALFRDGEFAAMEAFDTWLHSDLTFEQFKSSVLERNQNLIQGGLKSNVETEYTTENGNHLRFVVWNAGERDDADFGARILSIQYGAGDPMDSEGDAGNSTTQFLNGTVMNSPAEGIVEITNHFLGTTITLDMSDQDRPRRIDELGNVEEGGANHEVWVDFGWTGPNEGDFFHPFTTIASATAAVADGGVVKIMPGITNERPSFRRRARLIAPVGGVTIGAR